MIICQEKFHLSTVGIDVQNGVEHRLVETKYFLMVTPDFGNWEKILQVEGLYVPATALSIPQNLNSH